MEYVLVGETKEREGIYYRVGYPPLIEREHKYLSDPTPEEQMEIDKIIISLTDK